MAKKRNWVEMYENDHVDVADTLTEAKQTGKKFYRHKCKRHGSTVYATLDNTCPHCVRENAKARRQSNLEFNRPRELILQRKSRAKERGIPFEITTEDIRGHIPSHCPVFGVPLQFNGGDNAPSIDRLDSTCGYTKDNVRIISTRANRIKSDGTADEHIQVAIWQLKEAGLTSEEIKQHIIRHFVGEV